MRAFDYVRADTVEGAVAAGAAGGRFIAGGTNLIDLMKGEIETPGTLVDISRLDLAKVEELPDGGLRFGSRPIGVDAQGSGEATLFFRPHDVDLIDGDAPALPAVVTLARPRGGAMRVEAELEGHAVPLEIDYRGERTLSAGDRIAVRPNRFRLFPSG